jgi:hypothetical protein
MGTTPVTPTPSSNLGNLITQGIAIAPSIISLITSLVHHKAPVIESSNGPGTGPVKFADLFVSVMQGLTSAKVAGQIPSVPDDASAKNIIQAVISSMKLLGLLNSVPTGIPGLVATTIATNSVVPNLNQNLTLKAGQTLTVTVG